MNHLRHARLFALLGFALAAAIPAPGQAQWPGNCGRRVPLLEVTTVREFPSTGFSHSSIIVVTRDGWMVEATHTRDLASPAPRGGSISQCHLAVRFQFLGPALGRVRIGFAEDCRTTPITSLLGQPQVRITWYGRGGRSNSFVASFDDFSLPPCSPEIEGLLFLLSHL